LKKNKLLAIALGLGIAATALSGCSAASNAVQKTMKQMGNSDYVVYKMSNQTGKIMEYAIIRDKILNSESSSDGYYWVGETGLLHGLSGDVDHHEVKGMTDEQIKQAYHIPDDALEIPGE
jgi:hypothetical protein